VTLSHRQYQSPSDFDAIGAFLINHYQPDNRDGNWNQPCWEYMHSHPSLDEAHLSKIRIWQEVGGEVAEAGGEVAEAGEEVAEIVAVVNYETALGEAFFQLKPGYEFLKPEMLAYAETTLYGTTPGGERTLQVYINDFDTAFEELVKAKGYEMKPAWARPVSKFTIPHPFPTVDVPQGFRLKSLAEDNDLQKIHRVLWRGFNHQGEPPEDEIEGRRKMQSGPNFRHDLTIVVEAPDGAFVSFCGMWHEKTNHIAYVEPVATDPDYRRMGLGKAAVLEGIRRCGAEGATVAYVGSDQQFYKAIGFKTLYNSNCWVKSL
jgi:predicted N-acetyltransferase YhbS